MRHKIIFDEKEIFVESCLFVIIFGFVLFLGGIAWVILSLLYAKVFLWLAIPTTIGGFFIAYYGVRTLRLNRKNPKKRQTTYVYKL